MFSDSWSVWNENESSSKKYFVGGLSWVTDEDKLDSYFREELNVDVESVFIMRDKLGRSRGFGFVYFQDEELAEKIGNNHIVDGRKIEVKKAIPKNEIKTKKLFVGGIPLNLTEEQLRDYFEDFGTVNECSIMKDRKTHQPRGFGFVSFEEYEIVEKVLNDNHSIGGKKVEVKLAEPKKSRDKSPERDPHAPMMFYPPVQYPIHPTVPTFTPFGYGGAPPAYTPYVDTRAANMSFPMFDPSVKFKEFNPSDKAFDFPSGPEISSSLFDIPEPSLQPIGTKIESPFVKDMSRVVGGHRKTRKKATPSSSLFMNDIFDNYDERHSFSGFSDYASVFGLAEENGHRHSWS